MIRIGVPIVEANFSAPKENCLVRPEEE